MTVTEQILIELRSINTRLDGIDARLDGIDSRLDGIDARLDGIDARLDGIDARLDGIDARLDGVDTWQERADKKFDSIFEVLTDLVRQEQFDHFYDEFLEFKTITLNQFDILSRRYETHDQELAASKAAISRNEIAIKEIRVKLLN